MTMDINPESAPRKKPARRASAGERKSGSPQASVVRIAVGVAGYPEGQDAAALGVAIAGVTGAELMLVAVHPPAIFPVPPSLQWKSLREEAERSLREVRDSVAPDARIVAETDLSIPRALRRAVRRKHRDLLIVGSSRHAPAGHVRVGKRMRQLLGHVDCALAFAPKGLAKQPGFRLHRIGVGYDGGPEADAALAWASSIAVAAEAELCVRAVVDDRVPVLLRSALQGLVAVEWRDVVEEEASRLRRQATAATAVTGAEVRIEVTCRRPAEALIALSENVDLVVIGSRRWGPAARVLMGSTGEGLLQRAACPVVTVPRPAA
jgi:nucleotide-binding universal stress UspA family protein